MRRAEASESARTLAAYKWQRVTKAAKVGHAKMMAAVRWQAASQAAEAAEREREQSLEVSKGTGE